MRRESGFEVCASGETRLTIDLSAVNYKLTRFILALRRARRDEWRRREPREENRSGTRGKGKMIGGVERKKNKRNREKKTRERREEELADTMKGREEMRENGIAGRKEE